MDLHPMSFREFLSAMGRPRYASLLDETSLEPLPDAIHTELVDLLRKYYFTGGMPEAVRHFAETSDVAATREIHREILDAYVLDFAKHAPGPEIPKLGLIWDSIPRLLAKENKKFVFAAVQKGARRRGASGSLLLAKPGRKGRARLPVRNRPDDRPGRGQGRVEPEEQEPEVVRRAARATGPRASEPPQSQARREDLQRPAVRRFLAVQTSSGHLRLGS
jgi:hypothetical protein